VQSALFAFYSLKNPPQPHRFLWLQVFVEPRCRKKTCSGIERKLVSFFIRSVLGRLLPDLAQICPGSLKLIFIGYPACIQGQYNRSRLTMELRQCIGGLSPEEIQQLEQETELRLHTCVVCGRRNLYAIRNSLGKWVPEPHDEPLPRAKPAPKNRLL